MGKKFTESGRGDKEEKIISAITKELWEQNMGNKLKITFQNLFLHLVTVP